MVVVGRRVYSNRYKNLSYYGNERATLLREVRYTTTYSINPANAPFNSGYCYMYLDLMRDLWNQEDFQKYRDQYINYSPVGVSVSFQSDVNIPGNILLCEQLTDFPYPQPINGEPAEDKSGVFLPWDKYQGLYKTMDKDTFTRFFQSQSKSKRLWSKNMPYGGRYVSAFASSFQRAQLVDIDNDAVYTTDDNGNVISLATSRTTDARHLDGKFTPFLYVGINLEQAQLQLQTKYFFNMTVKFYIMFQLERSDYFGSVFSNYMQGAHNTVYQANGAEQAEDIDLGHAVDGRSMSELLTLSRAFGDVSVLGQNSNAFLVDENCYNPLTGQYEFQGVFDIVPPNDSLETRLNKYQSDPINVVGNMITVYGSKTNNSSEMVKINSTNSFPQWQELALDVQQNLPEAWTYSTYNSSGSVFAHHWQVIFNNQAGTPDQIKLLGTQFEQCLGSIMTQLQTSGLEEIRTKFNYQYPLQAIPQFMYKIYVASGDAPNQPPSDLPENTQDYIYFYFVIGSNVLTLNYYVNIHSQASYYYCMAFMSYFQQVVDKFYSYMVNPNMLFTFWDYDQQVTLSNAIEVMQLQGIITSTRTSYSDLLASMNASLNQIFKSRVESWQSFWSRVKGFFGKVFKGVKKVVPVVSKIAGAVGNLIPGPVGQVIGAVGQGISAVQSLIDGAVITGKASQLLIDSNGLLGDSKLVTVTFDPQVAYPSNVSSPIPLNDQTGKWKSLGSFDVQGVSIDNPNVLSSHISHTANFPFTMSATNGTLMVPAGDSLKDAPGNLFQMRCQVTWTMAKPSPDFKLTPFLITLGSLNSVVEQNTTN